MGYSTEFDGQFNLDKPLTTEHLAYLKRFARIRHMRWLDEIVGNLPDATRTAVGLPAGPEGMYLTNDLVMEESYNAPYPHHRAIIDYDRAPADVPDLWLQWVPTEDGTSLKWDGNEKFYDYVAWLKFLIGHFLIPWGYTLNGRVKWQGDDTSDHGVIIVDRNIVMAQEAA